VNKFLSDSQWKCCDLRELEPIVTRSGGVTRSGETLYLITVDREITAHCIITIMNRSTDPDLVRLWRLAKDESYATESQKSPGVMVFTCQVEGHGSGAA